MRHEEFLRGQLKKILLAASYDDSQTGAAVEHAMDYKRTNPNAGTEIVIAKAKFFAKHNTRPATPERREPIRQAALPKWKR
ncbi:hypothetical protein D8682_25155 [Buttiauxella sp. 3AFRM03]|uniref:hypothetical protein n=1 Tax=Buttiauxella sp. 3AFRM03 TaxID=2479367 RepID=UPI000EF7BB45|nr:hypothetical protein [Buttiauxella sp. 3AFRM03]AYN29974.1 hypothetical protein D8682_25155 [Buttiauxella sp. 3AFRM03]